MLGVIHLKDVVKPDVKERFAALRRMGIKTVMITGDNPVTAAAIASEAGVDDFIAEATPEDKLRYIRDEQAQGRLIAMCGDGTNDAPALAQADVGVAMQTGTQAAREAGNMVDLDSDPTKLIEVVEIGKQLLMTRGSLTTFSIANDVAKYFAIIPAMFVAFYPQLGVLNIMRLSTPQSAILSAIIFNALIIIALIPLALKGVEYRPIGAAALLRRNLLVYGARRHRLPFIGIKAIDLMRRRAASRLRRLSHVEGNPPRHRIHRRADAHHRARLSRWRSPALPHVIFPHQAKGSLIEKDGKVVGSALIGQAFAERQIFPRPPVGDRRRRTRRTPPRPSMRPTTPRIRRARTSGRPARRSSTGVKGDVETLKAREPVGAGPGRSGDHIGQRARSRYLAGGGVVSGAARGEGAGPCRKSASARWSSSQTEGRTFGLLGEPRVNVLEAQSRARRAEVVRLARPRSHMPARRSATSFARRPACSAPRRKGAGI